MKGEFTSDGCSGGMSVAWRALTGLPPPWEGCCVEHDRAYWRGGTYDERAAADRQLLICVAARGHPYWALAMYVAVRIGGASAWPTPWRWGYGKLKGPNNVVE
ncbi:MAG: hypothetical protein GEV13_36050 [Rhodospirillales bacterium]|nr:hypothetical protein [Rhodospirillales bacterium]